MDAAFETSLGLGFFLSGSQIFFSFPSFGH